MKIYRLIILLVVSFLFGQIQAQETKKVRETRGVITRAGSPLTLLGEPTVIGQLAPNFTAVDVTGQDVKLSDFRGRIVIIAPMPSVDTKVCAKESREFNQRATELDKSVVVLTISKDLPFALGRFCDAEGLRNIYPLSDYKASEFGLKYGFLIKENQLLARGVVVIDRDGRVVYVEYVSDISKEPNYDAVIEKVKTLKR